MTNRALREFVEHVVSPRWYAPFAVKGELKSCAVLKIKDLDSRQVEYHGLVDIRPFKAAQLAIKKMNRRKIGGKKVEARQWYTRCYKADRRDKLKNIGKQFFGERRRKERRRPNLVMDHYVPIRVEGIKGFNREYRD